MALFDCIRTRRLWCNAAARIGTDFSSVGRDLCGADRPAGDFSSMGTENDNDGWRELFYRWIPAPTESCDHSSDIFVRNVPLCATERDCDLRATGNRDSGARVGKLSNSPRRGWIAGSIFDRLAACDESCPEATQHCI